MKGTKLRSSCQLSRKGECSPAWVLCKLQCGKPHLQNSFTFPTQGPLLTTCTSSVVFATLHNGRLPRIVSVTSSIFMPCICKLLFRICYLRARSYCSTFEHLCEIKSFRRVSRHWALQQMASLCRHLLIAEVVILWKPAENQNQYFWFVVIIWKSFVAIVPLKSSASMKQISSLREVSNQLY